MTNLKYACLWLLYLISLPSFSQSFLPGPYPDRIILTWSADPATSQSVTWRTDTTIKQGIAQVYLENSNPFIDTLGLKVEAQTETLRSANYTAANYHSVTFTGLQPDTLYTYRVGDGKQWSEWFHFHTASDKPKPFSFVYLGDAQNDIKSKWSRVIRKAFTQQTNARFILHAGDLINRSNNDEEWGEWHYGGGFIHGMVPSLPSPGNHEYFRNDRKELTLDPHWQAQFTLPANGPKGLEESVYYLDYQDLRVISLNSQMIVLDENSLKQQVKWIEMVLQNNPNKWTIVTFHHPIYSTAKGRDNKNLMENFKPLFEKYHVDLVLQGHDHNYSRGRNLIESSSPKEGGPVYIVSVAGPKMYKIDSKKWMDISIENTQLFQLIHINNNSLKYESYKVNGELFDAFSINKNKQAEFGKFLEGKPKKR